MLKEVPVASVLLVDDEPKMGVVLKAGLESDDVSADVATSGTEALDLLGKKRYEVVITDLRMPDLDGIALLERIKQKWPETEVILITAYATSQTAVEALRKGAYDYVIKPFDMDELRLKVRHILEKSELRRENVALRTKLQERYSLENMVGKSSAMQKVYEMVHKVAPTDATVLIRGESGTGKELVAQAIHYLSPRASQPFVAVNCGALPENLLESELFGYERGAFTGADRRKPGRFELAGKGTLFLDEIGEMSLAMQVKLLRALQNRQIERLGGTEPVQVDARIICATNQDLEARLQEGKFRQDLYYRINVFPIFLPPLRERKEDIPELVRFFLRKHGAAEREVQPALLVRLMEYDWPGNVRELESTVERMLILAGDGPLTVDVLPPGFGARQTGRAETEFDIPDEGLSIEEVERRLIRRAIEKAPGNKSRAAQLLGITRRRLYSMMERLGVADAASDE